MEHTRSYYFSKPLQIVVAVNAVLLAILFVSGQTYLSDKYSFFHIHFQFLHAIVGITFFFSVVIGIVIETKLRKKFIEKLFKSEVERHALLRHFEYLVKYANDVILMMNEQLQIIDINDKGIELYGYSREEFIAMPVVTLIPEVDIPEFEARINDLRNTGNAINEVMHRRKNGAIIYVEVSSRVIEVEGEFFVQAIIRDISGRKQMELQLGELLEQLALFNNIAQVFLLTLGDNAFGEVLSIALTKSDCTDGFIGYLNEDGDLTIPAIQYKTMQFYRMHESSIIVPRRDWIDSLWGRVISKQMSVLFNQPYPSPGGHLPIHKALAVPFVNMGETIGLIVLANKDKDFSETDQSALESIAQFMAPILSVRFERQRSEKELIRAKERAQESDHLKTIFLQNMSHEIRTPMNAIVGFSELLVLKHGEAEKVKYYSSIIHQRSNDLLSLLDDLLFLSRIEAGQVPVQNQNLNVNVLLNELVLGYREMLESDSSKEVNLKLTNDSELLVILSDGFKIKHILANLLNNAVKFTSKGEIEIGFSIESKEKILFFVKDTGIGIAIEKQKLMFTRFRQIDEGQNRTGGAGLGLAIVKGLVDILGGTIRFESKAGEGSSFYFSLPCLVLSSKSLTIKKETSLPDPEILKGCSILIVEDDKSSSEFLRELLIPHKVKLYNVSSGEAAIDILSVNHSIDIVLMDVRLPGISGYVTTKLIRGLSRNIGIIAQTAHANPEDRKQALAAGCDDYLSKPINQAILFEKLIALAVKCNKKNRFN